MKVKYMRWEKGRNVRERSGEKEKKRREEEERK